MCTYIVVDKLIEHGLVRAQFLFQSFIDGHKIEPVTNTVI